MKINLPTAIFLIFFFFWVRARFYVIKFENFNVCFERLPETSEEELRSVYTVFRLGCMRGYSLIKYAYFYVSFEGLAEM